MMIFLSVLENSHSKKILMFDNVKEAKEFLYGKTKPMQKKMLVDDGKKHKFDDEVNSTEKDYDDFILETIAVTADITAAIDERCTENDYKKDYYDSYCSELFTCEYKKGVIHANKCYTQEQWRLRSQCVHDSQCNIVLNCYDNKDCRDKLKCYKDDEIKKKVDCWIGGNIWYESEGYCISFKDCAEDHACFFLSFSFQFPCYNVAF